MAKITINEISQNYSFRTGNASYCSVALPITACWGPGYFAASEMQLDEIAWSHFTATQAGLEAFVSTYRGPAANYRAAQDFSYQIAMTLLSSGYDIDVLRVCPGGQSQGSGEDPIIVKAKYPGSFGDHIELTLTKMDKNGQQVKGSDETVDHLNCVVRLRDSAGVTTPVENWNFTLALQDDSTYPHISEVTSNFVLFDSYPEDYSELKDDVQWTIKLTGGSDRSHDDKFVNGIQHAATRYNDTKNSDSGYSSLYVKTLESLADSLTESQKSTVAYREHVFTMAWEAYQNLKDTLAYAPNRIISPWDDQDYKFLGHDIQESDKLDISPIHERLMEVAAYSRCATAFIDVPRSLPRSRVYDYATTLSGIRNGGDDGLFATHSALFAPWGQYIYVGTSKQNICPPSVLALLIMRSMILNQSLQYEWALPTTRKHNVNVGKLDYTVPKKQLDEWQSGKGVNINVITTIPDLGTNVWGNSTLYSIPEGTYQALENLSTRLLMNALKNVVYRAGLGITFQYNNDEAYSKFYAACSPILDLFKNVGAINDYRIRMSADIDGLDSVNANSVIGKIWMTVNGVINDITCDLIALPSSADLSTY